MIRVTYTPVCDLCEAECPSEVYSCTGSPLFAYPVPSTRYTYTLELTLQICDSCAGPLKKLRDEIVQTAITKRNKA